MLRPPGVGDRVVLSWNPHSGHCFCCERAQPILCAQCLANGPQAFHFDGKPRLSCDAVPVHQLMYLGGFAEYCVVPAPARSSPASPTRRGANSPARSLTAGRGADLVIEAAGAPAGFRLSVEAVWPGGRVVWLGKAGVGEQVGFRWRSLMQEKRITRSSHDGAHPAGGHQRGLRSAEARRDGAHAGGRGMKLYEGGRSLAGAAVTVDGAPLDPRFDIMRFTPTWFEWTCEGNGPRQLALALLADHLGDAARALALTEGFMREVVAVRDNAWQLTSEEIDAALAGAEGSGGVSEIR